MTQVCCGQFEKPLTPSLSPLDGERENILGTLTPGRTAPRTPRGPTRGYVLEPASGFFSLARYARRETNDPSSATAATRRADCNPPLRAPPLINAHPNPSQLR